MKLLITGTLAAGLLFAAAATFAQTPPAHSSANKAEDKAAYKAQWKACMERMGANNKNTAKSEGQHAGDGKAAATGKAANSTATAKPESQSEAKKMNRHEQDMQACREQLYGGKHEEPATEGKDNGVPHN